MLAAFIVIFLYILITLGLYVCTVRSFFSEDDRRNDVFPHAWSLFVACLTPFAVVFLAIWHGGKFLQRFSR